MREPLVSVILPVHNGQEFLNIAIDSILLQEFKDFELLVVDCASTDHSQTIVNYYQDPRLKYSAIKSTRLTDGIAAGTKKARCEFIALMTQTDISRPERLKKQVGYLQSHPEAKLVGTHFSAIDENNLILAAQGAQKTKVLDWLAANPFAPGSIMVRGDIFETETNVYPKWWRLSSKYPIALLPEDLYHLRRTAISAPANKNEVAEDYELWLRAAGGYPVAVQSPGQPIKDLLNSKNQPTEALRAIEDLLRSANQIWAKAELNPAQQQLLEERINRLTREWARFKNLLEVPPTISVVMSVYNGQKHLKAAIKSILNQTFRDFEFIIIDDGSHDSSVRIINSFKDPRIRLISQANHGLIYSLNKGIGLARAQLIARQDADDMSMPERFEKELSLLMSMPSAAVVGGFWQYIDTQDRKGMVMVTPTKDVDLRRSLYVQNPFAHGATLIRKSAVEEAGGYGADFAHIEDYDLWRRLSDKWQFYQVPEILYLYRISKGSISDSNSSVQADISRQIRKEQWHKQFLGKSLGAIIKDGRHYKNLKSPLARQIYQKYIEQQWVITLKLFHRGAFKSGVINFLALLWLEPKYFKPLAKPAVGGLLRRLGIMESRDDIY